MILISHRGNILGPIPKKENHPDYVQYALDLDYDVEIDIWYINSEFWLGHDEPQYNISFDWLWKRIDKLWIHCKNIKSIEYFNQSYFGDKINYFWHEEDTITLTSHNWIWAYPGKQPIEKSIAVMPEIYNDDLSKCIGVCSDWINKYKKIKNFKYNKK